MKGHITKITRISHLSENNDKIEVQINGLDKYSCYGSYDDVMKFNDQDVEFEITQQGLETVICNIVETKKIMKIDTRGNIPELNADASNIVDSLCNLDSKLIGYGCPGAIIYVCYSEMKESIRARWLDLVCLDSNARRFVARTFLDRNTEFLESDKIQNQMIKCDLKTRAGYSIPTAENIQKLNVEYGGFTDTVIVAKDILNSVLETDADLKAFMEKIDLIHKLEGLCYVMPGYHLVEMAAEINYIEAECNIIKNVNKSDLYRLVFLSRAYLYADEISIKPELNNIIIAKQVAKTLVSKDISIALTAPADRLIDCKLSMCWDVVKMAAKMTMKTVNV